MMARTGIVIRNRDVIAEPDSACGPCASNGEHVFGPPIPTFIWNQSVRLDLPQGITLSARGELQKGAYIRDGASSAALSRSVLWPTCSNAHGILNAGGTDSDLTAWERHACISANHDGDIHNYKADFWKLRDVTLQVPVGFAFPQLNSAVLTLTVQNYFRWINSDLRMFDPESVSRNSVNDQNRSISEHVPPSAIFTASLRVTF